MYMKFYKEFELTAVFSRLDVRNIHCLDIGAEVVSDFAEILGAHGHKRGR